MLSLRFSTICLAISAGLLTSLASLAASTQGQWAVLASFPGAEVIDETQEDKSRNHDLIFGSVKKINHLFSPERTKRVHGVLLKLTYAIPSGRSTDEVYQHYLGQLAGGEMLYTCVARDCGNSSYWANRVFQQARLYGPEQYQRLIVASLSIQGTAQFMSIYVVRRGNKDVLVHLEMIASETPIGPPVTNEQFRPLIEHGVQHLESLAFSGEGRLLDNSTSLMSILELFNADPELRVYVVGHASIDFGAESALEIGRDNARDIVSQLIALGIAEQRLVAVSVGGYAPVSGRPDTRIELTLMR